MDEAEVREARRPAATTVLLAHPNPLVLLGLRVALEQQSTPWAIRCCAQSDSPPPDITWRETILVTDYVQGLRGCNLGASSAAPFAVLIVTTHDTVHEIRRALQAGVRGYLVAGFQIQTLYAAIRSLAAGEPYLCERAAQRMHERGSQERLTARESQVLEDLVKGLSNKAIGRHLCISNGTVKAHVKSIFAKLGVETRTQATRIAVRKGLVPIPSSDEVGLWSRPLGEPTDDV